MTADSREDVEKEKHSSIACGIASLYNHSGNDSGGSSENWTQYYQKIHQFFSWAYTQKMFQLVIGHMLHYVHCILIYNSQKLERTQISYNRGMDTENVAHLHNEVLSAIKNNNFMKFLGKWMDLENILSEVTQS